MTCLDDLLCYSPTRPLTPTHTTPRCRSSREQRWSGEQRQNVEQFLDEDELEDLRRTNLQARKGGGERFAGGWGTCGWAGEG